MLNLFPPGDDYQVPGRGENVGDAANVAFTKPSLKQNLKNVRAIFFCAESISDLFAFLVLEMLILTPTKADTST